jgi:hypothetical protein
LYRGRTDSTIPEIKTSSAVRSRYNDLKVAAERRQASTVMSVVAIGDELCILNYVGTGFREWN